MLRIRKIRSECTCDCSMCNTYWPNIPMRNYPTTFTVIIFLQVLYGVDNGVSQPIQEWPNSRIHYAFVNKWKYSNLQATLKMKCLTCGGGITELSIEKGYTRHLICHSWQCPLSSIHQSNIQVIYVCTTNQHSTTISRLLPTNSEKHQITYYNKNNSRLQAALTC